MIPLDGKRFALGCALTLIAFGIGAFLMDLFSLIFPGLNFPIHVMGMVGGAIVRNIYDALKKSSKATPEKEIDILGSVCLSMFVSMAVMTMRLWELASLAIPLVLLLIAGTLVTILFTYFITFRALGKDYDAAVMVA